MMEITLPAKTDGSTIVLKANKIVAIGANGSGKTRFGYRLEDAYKTAAHRISAQKSLYMPAKVSPTSRETATNAFLYGYDKGGIAHKEGHRWGGNPNTFLLNDYENLMVLLHTEEYEEAVKFKDAYKPGQGDNKPITKLDTVQKIWEEVLPHRKLSKRAGYIEASPTNANTPYNASEMSDGERVILYLIGEVISVPNEFMIIVDEPEMHIHRSITKKLWDLIEKERPDCTFVYLTHDIDFAISRQDAIKIWMKEYVGNNVWDYEILDQESPPPEQVYFEILGSRKPILFTEGDSSSIDYLLYQLIFPEFTVTPLGNCNKVFEATKAFNEQNNFHHLHATGIIDRDRRTDDDVNEIRKHNILVPEVAEAENLLLLEDVVRTVAKRTFKKEDEVFNQTKDKIVSLFSDELQYQATQHSAFVIKKIFERDLNPKVKSFGELDRTINQFVSNLDYQAIYKNVEDSFQSFISNKDYLNILKVYNNKGLVQISGLSQHCGLNSKNNEFLNFVLGILKENSSDSETIRKSIRGAI